MLLLKVPYSVEAPGALIGSINFFKLAFATAIALFGLGSGTVGASSKCRPYCSPVPFAAELIIE